jgi:hypothetical protein
MHDQAEVSEQAVAFGAERPRVSTMCTTAKFIVETVPIV